MGMKGLMEYISAILCLMLHRGEESKDEDPAGDTTFLTQAQVGDSGSISSVDKLPSIHQPPTHMEAEPVS